MSDHRDQPPADPPRAPRWRRLKRAGGFLLAAGALFLLWAAFTPLRGPARADPPVPQSYPTFGGPDFRLLGQRLQIAGDTVLIWAAPRNTELVLVGVDCGQRTIATTPEGAPEDYLPPVPRSIGEQIVADVCRSAPLSPGKRLTARLGPVLPRWQRSAAARTVVNADSQRTSERVDAALERLRRIRREKAARAPALMDTNMMDSAMARDTARP